MTPLARLLALPVRLYRLIGSPWLGRSCRFQPSCSEYALTALESHGGLKGGALAAWRICRCNPFGGQGYDPVPAAGGCENHPADAHSTPGCKDESHVR